jgi:spermidine synthase
VVFARAVRAWRVLDTVATPEGPLQIRQRGEREFLMTIAGRVLMTSVAHRSEDALAELTCGLPGAAARPRILLGGLGMGFTLRAALDRLPAKAEVDVVDLNPAVVVWCKNGGPLGPLTNHAADDRRVKIHVADVAAVIARAAPDRYDAILIDLYEGPHEAVNRTRDPLYGSQALQRTWRAIRPGGVFGVWSEEPDAAFAKRLAAAGFATAQHKLAHGGRAHTIYVGTKSVSEPRPSRPGPARR